MEHDNVPAWNIRPLLHAAITANNALAEAFESHAAACSVKHWLRDFRTIRLDIGQRTGKSTAMLDLCSPEDAIIVSSDDMAEYLCQGACKAVIFTAKEIHRLASTYHVATVCHPVVWVDSASWILEHRYSTGTLRYEDVLEVFGLDAQQQFILLG